MWVRLMLVGQAPGLAEDKTGKPFSGQAGSSARALFTECRLRESEFNRAAYQTSAAKCFPAVAPIGINRRTVRRVRQCCGTAPASYSAKSSGSIRSSSS